MDYVRGDGSKGRCHDNIPRVGRRWQTSQSALQIRHCNTSLTYLLTFNNEDGAAIAKKQKNDEYKDCIKEEVLFNTHTLSNIASYLPPTNLLNLALTCKRLGVSENDKPSLIEESADIAIKDLATKEQSASLPYYKGENALADYYLQCYKNLFFLISLLEILSM